MALHRFFLDDQVLAEERASAFLLRLSPEDLKHARVLRLRSGEHLAVVDASSDYFECEVDSLGPDGLVVRIARHIDAPAQGPSVLLAQGLPKGSKMDDVVRQGTELGISGFLPLACERSVARLEGEKASRRQERWQAVARSAAMQSGQPRIPEVMGLASVPEAVEALRDAAAVLVCWEEAPATAGIAEALAAGLASCGCGATEAQVAVVVGPEGGLTSEEVEAFLGACPRAQAVSLGPSILRTETAGVIAPALVLYELGALGGCSQEGAR